MIALLSLIVASTAMAQENQSSVKLENALRPKTFTEDKRITDNEIRAQSGSMSRYSLKFDLSYAGPAIDDLSNPNMPNPDNRPRPNRTSLSGYTGGRYRINSDTALNLSTGMRWYTPYQRVIGEDFATPKGEKDFELANPLISSDFTWLAGKTQMRSTVRASYITSDYYRLRGEVASTGFTQFGKYKPFDGRWIFGMALDFDYYFFDRGYRATWPTSKSGDGRISTHNTTIIPSLEYKITDALNFKSSIGWSYSNQRRAGNAWTWEEVEPTGRVGVGYAITREIYVNPFIGFYSKRPSLASSNISMSTVFSIF